MSPLAVKGGNVQHHSFYCCCAEFLPLLPHAEGTLRMVFDTSMQLLEYFSHP